MSKRWSSLEEQIERLLEQPFFRLFGGRLEPADIAKRLGYAMEDGRVLTAGKLLAPNHYVVRLNPEDAAEFEGYWQTLEREMVSYLLKLGEKRGLTFAGRPHIEFKPDPAISRGSVEVDAKLVDLSAQDQTMMFTAPMAIETPETPSVIATGARLRWGDRLIPLDLPFMTIGRSMDNDIIIESEGVSRHHAQIKLRQGQYVLRDLESANGTFVNGQRIQDECVLQDGDRIRLANVELIFEIPETWQPKHSR